MYLSLDRADNYRAEEQRKVKVERGKFWSVTKTLCYVVSFSMVARLSVLCPVTGLRAGEIISVRTMECVTVSDGNEVVMMTQLGLPASLAA